MNSRARAFATNPLIFGQPETGLTLAANAGVVATNVYLDDMVDFPAFSELYGEYFGPTMPASTTVQQIPPTERKADRDNHYPDLEQISLIAVRAKLAHVEKSR